jgi:type III secretion protein V
LALFRRLGNGPGSLPPQLRLLTRHSDLLLAGMVVGIVAMMIIPLPTPLLDILITTNISLAVILLLVSIYIESALRIAAFPSILLITTLFRLGLNVSSTRLILLQADAGEVISSFGNFVVAGNLVVGAVIFLILTLIQFIVIAKGSERVAEVAARFTLDAMPGKQMAIDADLRAGTIDMDQARRMRSALQRESQLYGSMDGAMKFVKGDAIAGILITIINIVGGLLIGVLQRDMAVGEAARVYSILTIGDGLVSQIPALLISTAAGIVVTRVASEDAGAHLGRDIGEQVMAQPRAIAIAAGLLVLLAIVPGLPTIPFLLLAAAAGSVAYGLMRARRGRADAPRRGARRGPRTEGVPQELEAIEDSELPPAIALELGDELATVAESSPLMGELIPGLRELMFGELGVMLPGVNVRAGAALHPGAYRILLAEVPMAEGLVPGGTVVALAGRERLSASGVAECEEVQLPGVAPPTCRVPATTAETLQGEGIELVDPATQMVLHLGQVLRAFAHELVGIQETQQLLDALERTHPTLVHEVVPKVVSLQTLSEVLRRLLEEGVPIRNLRDILEAVAEWGPTERDPVVLVEHIRSALRRQISHQYVPAGGALQALLLDPIIEQAVRDSIQRTDRGSYLAMEPELSREIIEAVREQLQPFAGEPPPGWQGGLFLQGDEPLPVVLTSMEIRRYVRRLLEVELPDLAVLSYNELVPQVQVQPVARVSVG